MFCPLCGFEYTQKMNYCKRCGENLYPGVPVVEAKAPRRWVALLFAVIAAFGLGGLIVLFTAYAGLVHSGLRGDELLVPFMASLLFLGGVSAFLIYQLSRALTTLQQTRISGYPERTALPESRPVAPALPAEARQPMIETPSVTEHTTRQFGRGKQEPLGRE